jgi:hypothetical protein
MAAPQNKVTAFGPDDLVAALEAEGITVLEEPGWRDRSRPYVFHPEGVMFHHTANDNTPVRTIRDGYYGLPGPLAQFYPHRFGFNVPTVSLIAWGSANHPGSGLEEVLERTKAGLAPERWAEDPDDEPKFYGNRWYWGIEAPGTLYSAWPDHQLQAIIGIGVALCKLHGWSAGRCIAHGEWTRRKKGDPDYMWRNIIDLRGEIQSRLDGSDPWPKWLVRRNLHPKVRVLRGMLYSLGYLRKTADWKQGEFFTAAVEAAVRAFQLDHGLVVDGIVGPKTRVALYAALAETERS